MIQILPSVNHKPTHHKVGSDCCNIQFGQNPMPTVVPSQAQSLGFGFLNGLAKIFRPTIENFLIGALAVDAVALWVPRVVSAAFRGAVKYDPTLDPTMNGKSPWQVKKHSLIENFKGLNWINVWEETWREVATVPAAFMFPTLVYIFARKSYGKMASELSYAKLTSMADTFRHSLKDFSYTPENYRAAMTNFIKELIVDTRMRKAAHPNGKTYNEFLDNWAKRLIDEFYASKTQPAKETRNSMEQLKKEFTIAVHEYNRQHQPKTRLYKYDHAVIRWNQRHRIENHSKWNTSVESTEQLFDDLVRWKDFAFEVEKRYNPKSGKMIGTVIEKVRKNLIIRKALYSIVSIVATLAFLFKLVKWAQFHDKYEANRLVQLQDLHRKRETVLNNTPSPFSGANQLEVLS